ncbi:MAG: prephenate dehydrogenase, partial [Lachnospiraceae bacterium]|nr:prephenate dehydrogenase [Lachnospiraceae bacterium]
ALRLAFKDCTIIAYDKDKEDLSLSVQEGICNAGYQELNNAFSSCDIIFLCTPVDFNTEYLRQIKELKKPTAIITDAGSVKKPIHDAVKELCLENCFIGGHPMAGSEHSGYASSRAGLLENAYYILTPGEQVSYTNVEKFQNMIKAIGSIPIVMSHEKHDKVTAAISHLPHMAAYALVNLIEKSDDEDETMKIIAAGGFKDITRIASSSAVMWQQICGENKEQILGFMDNYISSLTNLRNEIASENKDYLYDYFQNAKDYRDSFDDVISGPIKRSYRVAVSIPDEAGIIAKISSMFAKDGINLKNMGIVHNREFEEGVLRIEFYDEASLKQAISILRNENYTIFIR